MCRCRTKEALYQIGQRAYFAVGQFSGPTGNRKAGREGADKDGPVADWRTDVFAKSDEFVDQLLTFKRSPVHPVRDQDQAGNTVRGDSHRVDDLERADGRLEVQGREGLERSFAIANRPIMKVSFALDVMCITATRLM